nr:hypothetical protein L203_00448 [Cryptococcus depauperatus CBS 7841]
MAQPSQAGFISSSPPSLPSHLPQDPSSPFPAPQAYWHVPNGPFEFDNVGHCRPVADATLPHYASGCCEKGRVK